MSRVSHYIHASSSRKIIVRSKIQVYHLVLFLFAWRNMRFFDLAPLCVVLFFIELYTFASEVVLPEG